MRNGDDGVALEIFATCPQSADWDRETYARRVIDVARWSERWGCKGILVYSDNRQLDPWLVSHLILQHTTSLCPLVAVQPVYMHPYAVAKSVATFGHLYGRRIYLNMVAGGFKNDLTALNDPTPHDRRYDRLVEYTLIIRRLVEGSAPLTFTGEFYTVQGLKLTPALPPELFPGIFVSGSSDAGQRAAQAMGATAVKYPKAPTEETEPDEGVGAGLRVGIIARESSDEAWTLARARFPEDRRGQLTRQLATKVSDSVWHRQLSELAAATATGDHPYWLIPFENYKTMCPYLVGSYDRVGEELARYIALGYRSFILDIPPDEDELRYANTAFQQALERVA
ncbi:MAG: alkanesulfonate monooxygenase [Gemmatimonadetes bacterium]|nr:MAG: alkanesulfonate monooxygenase [Gemmatimonadota bacterium]